MRTNKRTAQLIVIASMLVLVIFFIFWGLDIKAKKDFNKTVQNPISENYENPIADQKILNEEWEIFQRIYLKEKKDNPEFIKDVLEEYQKRRYITLDGISIPGSSDFSSLGEFSAVNYYATLLNKSWADNKEKREQLKTATKHIGVSILIVDAIADHDYKVLNSIFENAINSDNENKRNAVIGALDNYFGFYDQFIYEQLLSSDSKISQNILLRKMDKIIPVVKLKYIEE